MRELSSHARLRNATCHGHTRQHHTSRHADHTSSDMQNTSRISQGLCLVTGFFLATLCSTREDSCDESSWLCARVHAKRHRSVKTQSSAKLTRSSPKSCRQRMPHSRQVCYDVCSKFEASNLIKPTIERSHQARWHGRCISKA
mmetsp:Transcript_144663/g.463521  ORF Transcript_144663/g.463521 Transcript_144663/m.463521 type:complete len:143 (-) Transcript_144663:366-794(-)